MNEKTWHPAERKWIPSDGDPTVQCGNCRQIFKGDPFDKTCRWCGENGRGKMEAVASYEELENRAKKAEFDLENMNACIEDQERWAEKAEAKLKIIAARMNFAQADKERKVCKKCGCPKPEKSGPINPEDCWCDLAIVIFAKQEAP